MRRASPGTISGVIRLAHLTTDLVDLDEETYCSRMASRGRLILREEIAAHFQEKVFAMLSDACFELVLGDEPSLIEFADAVEFYSSEVFHYGTELDKLRTACQRCIKQPTNREARRKLDLLATAVMNFYDRAS